MPTPDPDDDVLDVVLAGKSTSSDEDKPMVDIGEDSCELLLEDSAGAHIALMTETKANIQNVSHVGRATGVKKFDEVGPIQAAANEAVLKKLV